MRRLHRLNLEVVLAEKVLLGSFLVLHDTIVRVPFIPPLCSVSWT